MNFKILSSLFLSLLIFFALICARGQQWSDPSTIYVGGGNDYPDFTIDNQGIIHCVWAHEITNYHYKIYYSKSTDDGISWTPAQDISLNDTFWLYTPKIETDNLGHLFVTYTNDDNMHIYFQQFDGNSWSCPQLLSEGLPGSHHNRTIIDNYNRFYCFWFWNYDGMIYYRYYENGTWSPIHYPFNSPDHFFFAYAVCDTENVLHCIGTHHFDGETSDDDRTIYFTNSNDVWSDFTQISDNTSWTSGIDVRSDNAPIALWREKINDSPSTVGTMVSDCDNGIWTPPELIVINADNFLSTQNEALIIDTNDNVHIVSNVQLDNIYKVIEYQKVGNEWEGQDIETDNYRFWRIKLKSKGSILHMTYIKIDTSVMNQTETRILYRRKDVISGTSQPKQHLQLDLIPNPSSGEVMIRFEYPRKDPVNIGIFDMKGKLIRTFTPGEVSLIKNEIIWDGKDPSGRKVSAGSYLVRLTIGNRFISKKMIIR